MQLTGIIKKAGNYYVALCMELNVSSQGESIEEAKKMLGAACEEYVSYMKEDNLVGEIRSVPLEILREFLLEDVEYVRPSDDWVYSENITFEVEAGLKESHQCRARSLPSFSFMVAPYSSDREVPAMRYLNEKKRARCTELLW